MLLEEALGVEHPGTLFRGDEDHGHACIRKLLLQRLKLSHALDAVWSPGAAKEFNDRGTARDSLRQSVLGRIVGSAQAEVGSTVADLKRAAEIHA